MAQPNVPLMDPEAERVERAARVAAMLKRWAAEDVTGEPDWDVESIERITFRTARHETPPSLSKP